jgi:cytochrome P450
MTSFDLRNLPDDFIDNPHPHYAALRASAPVYELPGGGLFLSRHADLMRVYKDRLVFSSDKKVEFFPKFGDSLLYQHHTTSLVFNDAPLHTRVRKAIAGALSPRAISGMDSVV